MSRRLKELGQWIKANNRLEEKNQRRRENSRPYQGRRFGFKR